MCPNHNHRANHLVNPECGEKSIITYVNAFRNARKPGIDAAASSTLKPQAINSNNFAAAQALKALQSNNSTGMVPGPSLPPRNSQKKASGSTKFVESEFGVSKATGSVIYDSLPGSANAADDNKPNPSDVYAVIPSKGGEKKMKKKKATTVPDAEDEDPNDIYSVIPSKVMPGYASSLGLRVSTQGGGGVETEREIAMLAEVFFYCLTKNVCLCCRPLMLRPLP